MTPLTLSKSDARRALVRHHFAPARDIEAVFKRLRSIQFDPIAPAGCNHDLVLQARLADYNVGDWEGAAYQDRFIYDGWDKQASLVPFEGWPLRRIFHKWHREQLGKIFDGHPEAVETILQELRERGPLLPKECVFQQRKEEWKVSWHGPNLSKQTLRALWYSGQVMTTNRRKGHHVYDLTERVLPTHLLDVPLLSDEDSIRELVHERHRAVGLLRPNAAPEIWSYRVKAPMRKDAIDLLVKQGELVPVVVDGVKTHATPEFLSQLDLPSLQPRVIFVAPLDQLMWDRTMIGHLFDFDYVWEIYMPEEKRRWGYYVLPILFGDMLVGRIEFFCRKGVLVIRRFLLEDPQPTPEFWTELEEAIRRFMDYCSAKSVNVLPGIEARLGKISKAIK